MNGIIVQVKNSIKLQRSSFLSETKFKVKYLKNVFPEHKKDFHFKHGPLPLASHKFLNPTFAS